MRCALYEQHCIGNDEAAKPARLLIRVTAIDRLALFLPAVDVVAVNQGESSEPFRHLLGAVAVARGDLHAVVAHRLQESFGFAIAPHREQRSDMGGRSAEQRIGNDGLGAELWVGISTYRGG